MYIYYFKYFRKKLLKNTRVELISKERRREKEKLEKIQ